MCLDSLRPVRLCLQFETMCSFCPQMSETTKQYWKQLESFILDWNQRIQKHWSWLTKRSIYKCIIYKHDGIVEICFPILGRNRDRDKVEWKSAEIYGGAVRTTASCSEHFRGKALKLLSHHTDGINHMADSWLLIQVDMAPPSTLWISLDRRRNLRVIIDHHEITSAPQSPRTSPSRLLFLYSPFLGLGT